MLPLANASILPELDSEEFLVADVVVLLRRAELAGKEGA